MDFKQIIQVLRRRWMTIALLFAIAVGVSAAYTFTATKQYQSTATVFVSANMRDASDAYAATYAISTRMQTYADLATSGEVLDGVISKLDLDLGADALADKIDSEVVPGTAQIRLTVTDRDPAVAQAIDTRLAEDLADYLAAVETPAGTTSSQIIARVTDPADFQSAPVTPRTALDLVVAGLIGLVLGIGLAVARDVLDRSVSSVEHIEEVSSAPVLANVGFDAEVRKSPLLTQLSAFAPRTEAFRLLRTNLQFLDLDQQPRSLVITSAVPGEGKTMTAVNLAVALAQAGRNVLLVDGDLRRPRVASLLDLDGAVGLTSVLVGTAGLDDAVQVHADSGLKFLASGPKPPNPTEILQSRVAHDLLKRLRDDFDMVIVDAPPLLPVADAAVIATATDGAIVVARHGKTTREQLREAVSRLDNVGARIFGVVINMIPRRAAKSYYYYYYEDVRGGARKK